MRNITTILISFTILLVVNDVLAQTPLGINYQGIARSADGTPLINQDIGLLMSITNGANGSVDYEEEHHVETNEFGLFAVIVGQGQSSGSLNDVDWVEGNKWLQIEIDPMDQGGYMLVGTQQMLSVPYALYAAKSGDEITPGLGIDIRNGRVNNTLPDQPITLTGTGAAQVSGTYPNFTVNSTDNVEDADADPANELQTLSKTGLDIILSNGGGTITDSIDDEDADPANELQTLTRAGNTITLSDGGGSFTDEVDDGDTDPANEIQALSISGNTLLLSDGGSVDLSDFANSDGQNLADVLVQGADAGGNSITGLANPTVGQDAATKSYVDQVDALDFDKDASNELQTIAKAGNLVTLSNGGGSFTDAVNDADASSTNELNTGASYIANNTLRITDQGGNQDVPLGTLNANLNAGNNRITNVGSPVNASDAVNVSYVDAKDDMDYAISIPVSYSSAGAGDVTLDLSGAVLDKGGLISGSTITISETGVYALSVQGFSGITIASTIDIVVNGTPYTVLKGVNNYLGQYLFDLAPLDTVQIIVRFGSTAETISLQISAYKI